MLDQGGPKEAGRDKKLEDLRQLFPDIPVRLLTRLPGKRDWDPAALPFNRRRRRQIL